MALRIGPQSQMEAVSEEVVPDEEAPVEKASVEETVTMEGCPCCTETCNLLEQLLPMLQMALDSCKRGASYGMEEDEEV